MNPVSQLKPSGSLKRTGGWKRNKPLKTSAVRTKRNLSEQENKPVVSRAERRAADRRELPREKKTQRENPKGSNPQRRKAPKYTGPSDEVREAVWKTRAGERCEVCGKRNPTGQLQHRIARGTGGRKGDALEGVNRVECLISVCGNPLDRKSCHGKIEHARKSYAGPRGCALPMNSLQWPIEDERYPANVPVRDYMGVPGLSVLLTVDGFAVIVRDVA